MSASGKDETSYFSRCGMTLSVCCEDQCVPFGSMDPHCRCFARSRCGAGRRPWRQLSSSLQPLRVTRIQSAWVFCSLGRCLPTLLSALAKIRLNWLSRSENLAGANRALGGVETFLGAAPRRARLACAWTCGAEQRQHQTPSSAAAMRDAWSRGCPLWMVGRTRQPPYWTYTYK